MFWRSFAIIQDIVGSPSSSPTEVVEFDKAIRNVANYPLVPASTIRFCFAWGLVLVPVLDELFVNIERHDMN